jgi:hypothetical protein
MFGDIQLLESTLDSSMDEKISAARTSLDFSEISTHRDKVQDKIYFIFSFYLTPIPPLQYLERVLFPLHEMGRVRVG